MKAKKSCTSRESNPCLHGENRRTATVPVELTTLVSWCENAKAHHDKGANGVAIGTWKDGERLVPIGIEPAA